MHAARRERHATGAIKSALRIFFDSDIGVSSSIATATVVLACVVGPALVGMFIRARLPEHHLNPETKDSVKLTMGWVATMAALILGLLIASAKSSFDAERNGVAQIPAKIVFLDRMLVDYGPETTEAR